MKMCDSQNNMEDELYNLHHHYEVEMDCYLLPPNRSILTPACFLDEEEVGQSVSPDSVFSSDFSTDDDGREDHQQSNETNLIHDSANTTMANCIYQEKCLINRSGHHETDIFRYGAIQPTIVAYNETNIISMHTVLLYNSSDQFLPTTRDDDDDQSENKKSKNKKRKLKQIKPKEHRKVLKLEKEKIPFRKTDSLRHNFMERKRRQTLREKYERLRSILPSLCSDKAPKIILLKAAIDEVKQLHLEEQKLLKEKNSLLESCDVLWSKLYM